MLRAKIRWFATMNGMAPPSGTLPGDKRCPVEQGSPFDPTDMPKGEGTAWTGTGAFAPISWPNLKRDRSIPAEISIDFPGWSAASGGAF